MLTINLEKRSASNRALIEALLSAAKNEPSLLPLNSIPQPKTNPQQAKQS